MRYRPLTLTTATLAAVLALSSVSTLADVNLKNVNPSPLALNVQTEGAGCGTATGATAFTAAGLPLTCQGGVWKSNGGSFRYLGEWQVGYQQTAQLIHSSLGFCYTSGVFTVSINNSDRYGGRVYISDDGYWYVTTVESYFPRGQSMRATCIGT